MSISNTLLFSAAITIGLYMVIDSIGYWIYLRKLERRINELRKMEKEREERERRRAALLNKGKSDDSHSDGSSNNQSSLSTDKTL
jgi:hypothetical protein